MRTRMGLNEVYCGEIKRSEDRKLGEKIKILGRHPFLTGVHWFIFSHHMPWRSRTPRSDGMALFCRFETCSRDVLLSHMCRNRKCCDKLCHFGACIHMNDFSYNAVLLKNDLLETSRRRRNRPPWDAYEKVAQMCQNNEQNKIFIRKNCIFEMGKYCTAFQIQL